MKYVSIVKKFTFVDLFAGIGGFRIALEELDGKCLGYSEIDNQAIKVYQINFISYVNQDEINFGDIQKVDKLPFTEIDIIFGGVPCQPWSIARKIKGFNDPRVQLWFDFIRVVKANKPQGYFILNFAILYIYENTLLPALDNASLAICKASKFIAKI